MKTMTCEQMGGPCKLGIQGHTADEVIKAQDTHLKKMVEDGDAAHEVALQQMKARWRNPIKGMSWYMKVKKDFATLPKN